MSEKLKAVTTVLGKISWKMWILIIVALFVIWQVATGASFSSKLYNTMLDQLRVDQTNVIEIKEEQEKWYESEIAKLLNQIEQIKKDKAALAAQRDKSNAEITRLKGRINELQNEIANIVVSNDPDAVIDSLRRRFPSIRRR